MREALEIQFSCRILDWNVCEDEFTPEGRYSAIIDGEFIVADGFALLISALQERRGATPLRRAA